MNQSKTFRTVGLMALMAVLAGAACDRSLTITNINTNTNTLNGGESGANDPDAVEGDVTSDTVTVTINGMDDGENCPAGVQPANENKKFRLGCTLALTVNPRNARGEVIHDDEAPAPDYFISLGPDSVATFRPFDDNPYNALLNSVSPGKIRVIASVVGKRSAETEFEVIQ